MWILQLNPIRGKMEERIPVCRAVSISALEVFLLREAVPIYVEDDPAELYRGPKKKFTKFFRKGGLLEWYNPPLGPLASNCFLNVGTVEDWKEQAVEKAIRDYYEHVMALLEV